MEITRTSGGPAIITHQRLARIDDDGSVALGLLLDPFSARPLNFCLFWERGGDLSVFEDGGEHDMESLEGWEPGAIREAVAAAVASCPGCEADMTWFVNWASAAEATLDEGESAAATERREQFAPK